MTEQDKQTFATLMIGVAENYGQTITPSRIAMLFKALSNFSIADVEKSSFHIMANRKYTTFPTLADFLECLGGGSAEDVGQVEAAKVIEAMGRHGAYKSIVFDDPVTQAVIQFYFGGWEKICTSNPDKWFQHEFVKTYAAYRRQGKMLFGHLAGKVEIENGSKGLDKYIPVPVPVGEASRANAVLERGKQENSIVSSVIDLKLLGE